MAGASSGKREGLKNITRAQPMRDIAEKQKLLWLAAYAGLMAIAAGRTSRLCKAGRFL